MWLYLLKMPNFLQILIFLTLWWWWVQSWLIESIKRYLFWWWPLGNRQLVLKQVLPLLSFESWDSVSLPRGFLRICATGKISIHLVTLLGFCPGNPHVCNRNSERLFPFFPFECFIYVFLNHASATFLLADLCFHWLRLPCRSHHLFQSLLKHLVQVFWNLLFREFPVIGWFLLCAFPYQY